MSVDIEDHDPSKGEWLTHRNLTIGDVLREIQARWAREDRENAVRKAHHYGDLPDKDNHCIIRGYN